MMNFAFKRIGTIYTPYLANLPIPHQAPQKAEGEFWISIEPEYADGLYKLETYRYLYVLYYLDKVEGAVDLKVTPPWAGGIEVGLFASRSPQRPNPIGLSIVEIKEIDGNDIVISGIDAYNGTPLLDLKPYVHAIDVKENSNDGWYEELPDKNHLVAHMLGLEHDHGHEHDHEHTHNHAHQHGHAHNQTHEHSDHQHEHKHTVKHIKLSNLHKHK